MARRILGGDEGGTGRHLRATDPHRTERLHHKCAVRAAGGALSPLTLCRPVASASRWTTLKMRRRQARDHLPRPIDNRVREARTRESPSGVGNPGKPLEIAGSPVGFAIRGLIAASRQNDLRPLTGNQRRTGRADHQCGQRQSQQPMSDPHCPGTREHDKTLGEPTSAVKRGNGRVVSSCHQVVVSTGVSSPLQPRTCGAVVRGHRSSVRGSARGLCPGEFTGVGLIGSQPAHDRCQGIRR